MSESLTNAAVEEAIATTAEPPAQEQPVEGGEQTEAPAQPSAEEVARAAESKADRRYARLTARNAALMAEVEKLAAMVPKRDPNAPPTQEDHETRVRQEAAALVRKQAFDEEAVRIRKGGDTEYGAEAFGNALGALWNTVNGGKVNVDLVEAAIEAGNAHQLLYRLSQDPDEAERIAGLSPARMGAALAKMAAVVPAARPQSQAPAPIKPLAKGSSGDPAPRPDGDMDSFSAWYAKQREARGR